MFASLQNPLSLLGRLLLAVLFLPAGISKITGFAGTVGYIGSVGLPFPTLGAALAIVVEVGGGLALIFGLGTRWAALILAAFTLAASIFFHAFWAVPAEAVMVTQLLFIKNIAVIGGLLTLAAWGPGAWSLDGRK
ncbi:putative oxidoreductase [Rhodoferax sp. OV413]|uniref:DoxX family protein n=1 Tax=Rhodoferax sp. OV413 TaxID=1855285 RepID=UPI00087DFE3F|nr:DoxX family protein [Rhodoferax sp. OV413]SDN96748.1 putative oxidoreductase [Rhodoferax sp. OV413]